MEMNIKELFEVGVNFETAIGLGTKGERAKIAENTSCINISNELIEEVKKFNQEINFLVSGEKKFLAPILNMENYKVPTIVVLDKDINMH